jgi:hypothetical protein
MLFIYLFILRRNKNLTLDLLATLFCGQGKTKKQNE